jgi:hypothetical protein
MRRLFIGLIAGLVGFLGHSLTMLAQEDDSGATIAKVIEGQFAAFAADDAGLAYSFASPMIRQMFVSPENFGRMVRGGYPMIWAAEEVQLRALRDEGGRRLQRVFVKDQAGAGHLFDYEMVMIDGAWRINGVFAVPQDQLGV